MCPGVWSVSVEAAVTERGAVHYITPAAVATVAGPPPYQADLRLASDVSNVCDVTYGANCDQEWPLLSRELHLLSAWAMLRKHKCFIDVAFKLIPTLTWFLRLMMDLNLDKIVAQGCHWTWLVWWDSPQQHCHCYSGSSSSDPLAVIFNVSSLLLDAVTGDQALIGPSLLSLVNYHEIDQLSVSFADIKYLWKLDWQSKRQNWNKGNCFVSVASAGHFDVDTAMQYSILCASVHLIFLFG